MRRTVLSLLSAVAVGGISAALVAAPALAGDDCCKADGSCKRE